MLRINCLMQMFTPLLPDRIYFLKLPNMRNGGDIVCCSFVYRYYSIWVE